MLKNGVKKKPIQKMSVKRARYSSIVTLGSMALAAVFLLLGMKIIGSVLLCLSLIAFCALLGTGVYRIIGGQPVDDLERRLMHKSCYLAYWILGSILIIGTLILRIVSEASTLLQSETVHEFLFWVVMALVLVIPSICLAWQLPTEEVDPDEI